MADEWREGTRPNPTAIVGEGLTATALKPHKATCARKGYGAIHLVFRISGDYRLR